MAMCGILKSQGLNSVVQLIKDSHRALQGRRNFQGLEVSIENRKGGVREGIDPDGNEWRTKMKYPYGYIRRTEGADGDHIDCFVGPDEDSSTVYIVHIKDPKTDKYDEDKVMLGFYTKEDAEKIFRQHYDDYEKFYLDTTTMTMEEFKKRIFGDFENDRKTRLMKEAGGSKYLLSAFPAALMAMMGGRVGRLFDQEGHKGEIIGNAIGGGIGFAGGATGIRMLSKALAGNGVRQRAGEFTHYLGTEFGRGHGEGMTGAVTKPIKDIKNKIFHPFRKGK